MAACACHLRAEWQTQADPGLRAKPVRKKSKWAEFWWIVLETDLFSPPHSTHTCTYIRTQREREKQTYPQQKLSMVTHTYISRPQEMEEGRSRTEASLAYIVRPCFKRQNKNKARQEQKINSHWHIRYMENNAEILRKTFAKRSWWYKKRGSRSWPQRFHPRNAKTCTSAPYDDRRKKKIQSSLWDWQIISNRHISIDTGSTGEHSCSLSTAVCIVKTLCPRTLFLAIYPKDLSTCAQSQIQRYPKH